jgi:peptide/nickel transport system ATP-binding protein
MTTHSSARPHVDARWHDGGDGPRAELNSGAPALAIRDLVVEFPSPDGGLRAVDGVSYAVEPGRTLAVVGETGAGKSVTALAALGLLPAGRVISGSVEVDGVDLLALSESERRRLLGRLVAMVFQDPSAALNPVITVGAQLVEAIAMHQRGWTRARLRARAIELLGLVGVPQADLRARQYPHQFSGGMAQRVVIAMAIANRPRVLIADEPTNSVDVTIQAQLLELLRQAQVETGAATVLITHDLGVVAEFADRMVVMYAGRIVEEGSVRDIFARPSHPYTRALLASLPRLDAPVALLEAIPGTPPDMRALPPGCAFAARCRQTAGRAICTSERPALLAVEAAAADASAGHDSACHFRNEQPRPREPVTVAAPTPEPGPPLLSVRNLVKHFALGAGWLRAGVTVRAVDGISFDVRRGETLGLVGESGCGKSTTGNLIMRLLAPSAGTISFDGVDISRLRGREARALCRSMQMVFQDPYSSLNPLLSAGRNVVEPLRVQRIGSDAQRRDRAAALFDEVGLRPEHLDRWPDQFSGGQRQRIGIARALALDPALVILDEPVSSLDVSVQAQVLNLLRRLQASHGHAYVFISHDLSVVRHLCDRIAVMYLGRIVETGPRDAIFTRARHPYTRALLSAVPRPDPAAAHAQQRTVLRGELPSLVSPPRGCRFASRCPQVRPACADTDPLLVEETDEHGRGHGHAHACLFPVPTTTAA